MSKCHLGKKGGAPPDSVGRFQNHQTALGIEMDSGLASSEESKPVPGITEAIIMTTTLGVGQLNYKQMPPCLLAQKRMYLQDFLIRTMNVSMAHFNPKS